MGLGQTLAGLVVASGVMELLSSWFGASNDAGTGLLGALSWPTAACLVALGVAVFFARPEHGPASLLSSDSLTGSSVRRTLVMLVLVPIALSWLRLLGQRQGFYGTEVGIALLAASTATVSVALMLLDARRRHEGAWRLTCQPGEELGEVRRFAELQPVSHGRRC